MADNTFFWDVTPRIEHDISQVSKMENCHMHRCNELFFLVHGNVTIDSNADILEVSAPAVLIFNSYSLHRGNSLDDTVYDRYKVYFDDTLLNEYFPCSEALRFFKSTGLTAIRLTEKMRDILLHHFNRYEDFEGDKIGQDLLTTLILYEVYGWCSDKNTITRAPRLPYINDVMHYIVTHYDDNITLDSLASAFFVSRAKLVTDFKQATGMTVKNYLTLVRLNSARSYLNAGNTVSQTASLCGYNNESNFISQFSKYFNISPGTYIKKMKQTGEVPLNFK